MGDFPVNNCAFRQRLLEFRDAFSSDLCAAHVKDAEPSELLQMWYSSVRDLCANEGKPFDAFEVRQKSQVLVTNIKS